MSVCLTVAWLSALDQRGDEPALGSLRGSLGAPLWSSAVALATAGRPPSAALDTQTSQEPQRAPFQETRRGSQTKGE